MNLVYLVIFVLRNSSDNRMLYPGVHVCRSSGHGKDGPVCLSQFYVILTRLNYNAIELFSVHKTTSGEKRKALRKEAQELAKQSRASFRRAFLFSPEVVLCMLK